MEVQAVEIDREKGAILRRRISAFAALKRNDGTCVIAPLQVEMRYAPQRDDYDPPQIFEVSKDRLDISCSEVTAER